MMQLYPEIYSCVGCNACTKAAPRASTSCSTSPTPSGANMRSAPRSPLTASCAASAPPAVPPASPIPRWPCWPAVSTASTWLPNCEHLDDRIQEIAEGKFEKLIERPHGQASQRDPGALQQPRDREIRRAAPCIRIKSCRNPSRRWRRPGRKTSSWTPAA